MLDLEAIKRRINNEYGWRKAICDIERLIAEVEGARVERDRWHNAATVLSVELARVDDRAIAMAAEIERLREFETVTVGMPEVSPEMQREYERWNRGE